MRAGKIFIGDLEALSLLEKVMRSYVSSVLTIPHNICHPQLGENSEDQPVSIVSDKMTARQRSLNIFITKLWLPCYHGYGYAYVI